jgi:hypothetical protein
MDDLTYGQITKAKLSSSYPKFILDNIKLLSIDKNKSKLAGSYSFAFTQFPSDIDVQELVNEGDTYDKVVDFFIHGIKDKVREISNTPYYWILDIKMGIDRRFDFNIKDKDAHKKIIELHNDGLLNDEEMSILMTNNAELLLKELSTLRWKPNEILHGYKILRGNVKISIYGAITQKSVINIEVVGLSNDKYMDLSNFFTLAYHDEKGNLKSINLPDQSVVDFNTFFVIELKKNIKKLYYSDLYRDYAKLVKRYWSYGRFVGDEKLIQTIAPYMNSIYALAGQKKSEIALLIKLVDHTSMIGVPLEIFKNQLSNIKLSLSNVVDIDTNILLLINNNLDSIIDGAQEANNIVRLLEEIKDILSVFLSNKAIKFLKNVGLAPPPNKYIN